MSETTAPKAAKKAAARRAPKKEAQHSSTAVPLADEGEQATTPDSTPPETIDPESNEGSAYEFADEKELDQARWQFALEVLGDRIAWVIENERTEGDVPDTKRGRVFPPQLIVRDALVGGKPPISGVIPWEFLPERLTQMQENLPLSDLDLALILIAVSISMDPRFEHFFIVLNNDVEARGPMVSTALRLVGASSFDADARARFRKDAPLLAMGLMTVGPSSRSLMTQVLNVPERLVSYLLGSDDFDSIVRPLVIESSRNPLAAGLLAQVPEIDSFPTIYRARAGSGGRELVIRHTIDSIGCPPLMIDARHFDVREDRWRGQLLACIREAALDATLLALDTRGSDTDLPVTEILDDLESTGFPSVVLVDPRRQLGSWEPRVTTLPLPSISQRRAWWAVLAPDADPALADTTTHLDPEDIALYRGSDTTLLKSRTGSKPRRSKIQIIDPAITFNDVVLGERPAQQLRELRDRLRYRSIVLDDWQMRPGGGRGRGVTALFAGPSGTGKTMSAEALAGELGVPLFLVDLASVIDKYIGETEKNLEQIFMAVENDDGVLLFDEADALFGKRSEVSDARDRYANVEVAYLLQRIESFDGLAILTTNLRANLDEAFQRRLDMVVDFPEPDDQARRDIWRAALGRFGDSITDDDRAALATLDIAGGSIRSAVVTAAYLAAADGAGITRWHVMRGVQEEWRKMGRLNFPIDTFRDWEVDS